MYVILKSSAIIYSYKCFRLWDSFDPFLKCIMKPVKVKCVNWLCKLNILNGWYSFCMIWRVKNAFSFSSFSFGIWFSYKITDAYYKRYLVWLFLDNSKQKGMLLKPRKYWPTSHPHQNEWNHHLSRLFRVSSLA